MKILINGDNQILSFGEYVYPENKTQKIVVLEDLTVKNIILICESEGIEIKAKRKMDIISEIINYLKTSNINEVTKMSDTQVFEDIVVNGFAGEKSDNDMFKELFQAGCEYADLKKTFNSIVSEKGLRLTAKERVGKTSEFLEGYLPDVEDIQGHLGKVSALQDFLGVSSTQAGASMRKWAKDNDITLPKVPKTSKAKMEPGFRGNAKIVADWAMQNVDATLEELVAYASANVPKTKSGKDTSGGHALTVFNALVLAKAIFAPTDEAEAEVEMEEAA